MVDHLPDLGFPVARSLFSDRNPAGLPGHHPLLGAVFGLAWSQLGYTAATRPGSRDFSSVNQIVATKYEVLVERKHAIQARELLAATPQGVTF